MSDHVLVDPSQLAEQAGAAPDPEASEIDRIDPDPGAPFKMTNGRWYRLQRLRTRQFLRLLRIITVGAGPMLVQEVFRFASSPSAAEGREAEVREFAERFLTMLMLSITEAENQFIDFLKSMVLPADFVDEANLPAEQVDRNRSLLEQHAADWQNPEIEDTFAAAERIVRQEAKDIYDLGNRLARMWQFARKAGQTKDIEAALASAADRAS